MSDKVLPRPCDARPAETMLKRLLYCAGMLSVHGLLTDTEQRRVHDRMVKLQKKEAK